MRQHRLNDTIHILQNSPIGKAQHPETLILKEPRAGIVSRRSLVGIVLAAICLDYQLCGKTTEVNDVGTERNLAAKMCAFQHDALAQRAPQFSLCFRHRLSHGARETNVTGRWLGMASVMRAHGGSVSWKRTTPTPTHKGEGEAGCSGLSTSQGRLRNTLAPRPE